MEFLEELAKEKKKKKRSGALLYRPSKKELWPRECVVVVGEGASKNSGTGRWFSKGNISVRSIIRNKLLVISEAKIPYQKALGRLRHKKGGEKNLAILQIIISVFFFDSDPE